MISRIDIIATDDATSLERAWLVAARAQADCPGFLNARLHRTYRRINATGYDLVSIVRWRNLPAYYVALTQAPNPPLPGSCGVNLYGLVDGSPQADAVANGARLIITNPYRIRPHQAAENAAMWNATKTLMETREGFVGAELFQTFNPDADEYYFVSRAEWETEDRFMQQFAGQDYKKLVAPFEGTFQICFSTVVQDVSRPN